jgi:PAS domain S-box-containing protein
MADLKIKKGKEKSEDEEKTEEIEKRTKELEETRRALINMLEDVEEARLGAEEERSKTQAIITNFVDGLLVFNKENILTLINPKAEDFFKTKGEKIIGRPITELAKLPNLKPLIKLLSQQPFKTEIEAGIKEIFREELEVRENFILEISTFPILREKEKLGTSVISHDISREKLIERMKTEFVSLAAHQLRTPLSAIKWTLRMVLDGDLGQITQEQRDFLQKTYQSNERMISLINDLLNVTRIEEGRYLFKPVLTGIEEIIQPIIKSYREEMKRKKIKLLFQIPKAKLPKLEIDKEKIGLAIENLIDNALRYTLAGGQVTVALKCDKKEIELSVKDSGVGIPKDQQDRIFTKFFRGANVIRMETEGSGLGLFITKNIIEAHGGKIWFESKEEKGSTFYFTLPVKKD